MIVRAARGIVLVVMAVMIELSFGWGTLPMDYGMWERA